MIKVSNILKDHREAGAFHRLVSVQTAVGDGVFTTKSGDVLCFIQVRANDYECMDPEELDLRARRVEAAVRLMDERIRLHQLIVKRSISLPPPDVVDNPILAEALKGRDEHLRTSGPHYSLETYFAIVYEGARPASNPQPLGWARSKKALMAALSQSTAIANLGQEVAAACDRLLSKANSFIIQMRDVIPMQRLGTQGAFRLLYRLLNYDATKPDAPTLKFNEFVDFQACDSSLESHADYLRLDGHYIQVLTLKEPPRRTWAGMFRALAELPCNAVIATEWQRADPLKIRRLIQSKRRHFHNSKTSALSYFNQSAPGKAPDMLIDDGAVAVVGDLGASLEETDLHGRYFGQYSLTIALHDADIAAVRRGVAQCFKTFGTHDAHLIEERYNRLNAWLAIVPGNSAYNLRHLWLLNTNYADLSFLTTLAAGCPRNDYLDAPSLAIFEGAGGVPYHFNLHCRDVAHTLVLGATGSGKSFLLNFLLTFLQRYSPTTAIFDLGGSYENLTRLFGGRRFALSSEQREFTINPFCLEPTPENLQFLFAFVKVLVERNGWRLAAEDEKDVFDQIENLYAVPVDQRRLFTLANIVRRPVRMQLARWVEGGPYASLFDNPRDTLTLSRFQTFDFEGMSQAGDQLEPLLFWLLYRAAAAIADADDANGLKVFVIDEAWRFFRHPVIRGFIVEAMKTWRKKNALMMLATQSGADLMACDLLPTIVEGCVTKLFLSNPGIDQKAYQEAFHLNATEVDLIARLLPKQQILVKQPDASKLVHLRVDPRSYWLYTNNPQDNHLRRETFKRLGFQAGLDALTRRN